MVRSAEPGDLDDMGHVPSINAKSREVADMQDMYRRTLAASWTSRAGDLPADKLVEDLFAGSACWNNKSYNSPNPSEGDPRDPFWGAEAATRQTRSEKMLSPSWERQPKSSPRNHSPHNGKRPDTLSTLGRAQQGGSIEQQLYNGGKGRGWKSRNADHELCEFDVRKDLRSWEIAENE